MQRKGMCQKKLLCLSEGLTFSFRRLGSLVARRPWWFIIAPVIFTVLTSIWCINVEIDGDTVKLFGPSGSSYHRVRKLILHNFPLSKQEHYDIGRETKFISGYGRLLVETLDGGSLFRPHIVDEIFKIDKIVRSMEITDPKGEKWDYESLCARYYGTCFVNPTIHLAEHLGEILSWDFKIEYPLELSKDQLQFHYYGATLGGVTLDSEGYVINATKAQLVYFLDNVDPEKEALITTWEHSYLDLIDQIPLQYLRVCKMATIGIDDTFIFLAAWRTTDPKDSVEKRLALSYERSAVSVTLTSVTNCASFLACTSMPYLATRIFGISAVVSCVLVYIYQLTFMGGIMALTGRLEAAGYHGIFPWVRVREESENPSWIGKVLCIYKTEKKKTAKEDNLQNAGMIFFRDYYGKFLTNKAIKGLILGLFMIHIGISIYGFTQLKTTMHFSDFYSYDSYGKNFTELELKEFYKYSARLQFIIEEPVDYSKKEVQKEFYDLIKDIQESPYVASEPILNEFWLTYYLKFLNHSQGSFIIRGYNVSTKAGFINCLRFQFFRLKQSQRFKNDVYFNANYTEILSSRFVLQMVNTTTPLFIIDGHKWIDNRLEQFKYKVSYFHAFKILFEALTGIFQTLVTTISFTILAMLIVTFIFMPDFMIGVSVTLSLIVIELGIIGYMDFWGLNLNALTLFGIILFIGLSVDNTAHILNAFTTSKSISLDEKMCDALGRVGMPILQGCLSSIVGMIALSFLPAYAYLVLFKSGLMLLIFSLVNSLAVIPVLLSLFSRRQTNKIDFVEEVEVKEPLNISLKIT
ncbi:daf-6 [Cordylochernes scorpioides]|uniref:Daf-6 n=1 Tax=Cordylochernes scorpioides TaxID=51811 RepID=A0ABY6KPW0_9ARAC|nr:daf-6 [Cordylochernes scorpioides]